jgi:hypothetical protein
MHFTPNRLEDHWLRIKPLIQQEWNRLSESDLDAMDGRFDLLVTLIRQRYGGRVEIIQEAAIRDTLNRLLKTVEQ